MSIKVIEESERFPCLHCGNELCWHQGYGPEFGLCFQCAEAIANLYSLVHSGEPLTWGREAVVRPTPVPQAVKWRVLRRDGFRCRACGDDERPLHVDHITPRKKGGSNSEGNLQALCDRCNLSKGAK